MEDWTSYIPPAILAVMTAVVFVLIVLALRSTRDGQTAAVGNTESGEGGAGEQAAAEHQRTPA